MDNRALPVFETLDRLGIPYTLYEHEDVRTMEDCDLVDAVSGIPHCKNLFLCNRQCTDFYILLIGAHKKFRTADVSKQLGVSRLSFGNAEQLDELMGLYPGAVSPMGLINDTSRRMQVVMDSDVGRMETLLVHPNVSTASIAISGSDLRKFITSMGYAITEVNID